MCANEDWLYKLRREVNHTLKLVACQDAVPYILLIQERHGADRVFTRNAALQFDQFFACHVEHMFEARQLAVNGRRSWMPTMAANARQSPGFVSFDRCWRNLRESLPSEHVGESLYTALVSVRRAFIASAKY